MRLTKKQRQILEALAKDNPHFLGDDVYMTWLHVGMGLGRFERSLDALQKKGLIVWRSADDIEITDAGRKALKSVTPG